jgi:hypothetical protein
MALAAQWVSRITTVVLEMVLPGAIGHWLDRRWDMSFLSPIGFAFGVVLGTWHLVVMTRPDGLKSEKNSGNEDSGKQEDTDE